MTRQILSEQQLTTSSTQFSQRRDDKRRKLLRQLWAYRFYYLLALPGILYFIIFHYLPMLGIVIAFKDISPFGGLEGIISAPWVGFKHFNRFFSSIFFWNVMGNTLIISGLKILVGFPAPILFALMLNEVMRLRFKRIVQTISYLPHFISWVVVTGLVTALLATSGGVVTEFLNNITGNQWSFITNPDYFRAILVGSDVWKNVGWSSIIYLAAMSGIDPHLYEAAAIDGANRFQMARFITLPGIAFVIAILFIFEMGHILDAGFEQILLLYSPSTYGVADIIDTYVYREGLIGLKYSFAAAVGLFKGVMAFVMILITNIVTHRLGQPGIW
ncbi:MAG: ABC transporter permease subunit [Chloroflexi bacterium]|nr:ABC transporter permease subunit [Chloroflexota bacterium]